MHLYWAPNTRSLKALWMLEESGLSYDLIRVSLDSGELQQPTFRAINPMMKVPAIIDGPVKVAESGAILVYIAEQAGERKLAPGVDHPRRGDYLRWMFFAAGCIEAAFTQKVTGLEMPPRSAGWGDFDRVIDVLDAALDEGPWLLGDKFTAADVAIGSDLRFGVDVFKIVEARPNFRAYIDRCTERAAFKRAVAIETADS